MAYNSLVKSYKRLYRDGRITKEFLDAKLDEGQINQEEYDYIMEARN